MRTTNWQDREAARIGNNRAIGVAIELTPGTHAYDEVQRKAREIRRENIRRTAAAS